MNRKDKYIQAIRTKIKVLVSCKDPKVFFVPDLLVWMLERDRSRGGSGPLCSVARSFSHEGSVRVFVWKCHFRPGDKHVLGTRWAGQCRRFWRTDEWRPKPEGRTRTDSRVPEKDKRGSDHSVECAPQRVHTYPRNVHLQKRENSYCLVSGSR